MDKAQTRILFLILMGLLFFGQAIYDYLKKNKKRPAGKVASRKPAARHAMPAQKQATRKQAMQKQAVSHKQKATNPTVSEAKHDASPLLQSPEMEGLSMLSDTTMSEHQPVTTSSSEPAVTTNSANDIRNAVIWSEILKRKF